MPEQYAGLDIWSPLIALTSDDDVRDASSYAAAGVGLADRTVYLKNRGFYSTPAFGGTYTNSGTYRIAGQIVFTPLSGVAIQFETARIYGRSASIFAYYDSAAWSTAMDLADPEPYYQSTDKNSLSSLKFEAHLPTCRITTVRVRVEPDNGHLGFDLTKPKVRVWKTNNVTGATVLLAEADDPSLTFGAYNLPHTIDVTVPGVPDALFSAWTDSLHIQVYNEIGTDAQLGLIVKIPRVEFARQEFGQEFGEQLP